MLHRVVFLLKIQYAFSVSIETKRVVIPAHLAKTPYTNSGCPMWWIAMLKKAREQEKSGFWGHLRRSVFRHA